MRPSGEAPASGIIRLHRESGGIGRRTGFRFRRRKAWGFESLLSHQVRSAELLAHVPGSGGSFLDQRTAVPRDGDPGKPHRTIHMQQAVETKPSPLERQAEGGGARRATRGGDRRAHQEARAHREDAGLPARQGAHQDGGAPLRLPGAPGGALGQRAAPLRRGGAQPELPRRRHAALRARAGRRPTQTAFEFQAVFEVYPEITHGRPLRAQGHAPGDGSHRQGRRRHHRDAAQAARQVRARQRAARPTATS